MTGSPSVHSDTPWSAVRRPSGRGADQRPSSGEGFQSAFDAAAKRSGGDGQTPGSEVSDGRGSDAPLVSLLAEIDQRQQAGAGLGAAAVGQPNLALNGGVDGKGGQLGASFAISQEAQSGTSNGSANAQSLGRGALNLLSDPAISGEAEVALRTAGGGADGRGSRLRVDLVSMRTDFQPAETVALDGQVRTIGASQAAHGLGRFLASADARAGLDSSDEAAAFGDADSREDGASARLRGTGRETAADKDMLFGGKGDKNSLDGKMATAKGAWGADDAAVFTDSMSGGRPSRQVASAVAGALADTRPSSAAAGDDGRLHLRAGGSALKTIQIQLQPEQLGKLDVTMRLVDGQLAIHLVASKAETALRLKDDADGLKSLLTNAGFALDDAAISIAAREPAAQRSTAAMPADSGGAANGRSNQEAAGEGAGRFENRESPGEGAGDRRPRRSPAPVEAGAPSSRRDHDPSTYL